MCQKSLSQRYLKLRETFKYFTLKKHLGYVTYAFVNDESLLLEVRVSVHYKYPIENLDDLIKLGLVEIIDMKLS